ncbi:MAG: Spy/CpxP family protein refolding chaperone [Rhodoblastus sp.]
MKMIKPAGLALTAALGVAGAMAIANAQTQPPAPPPPAAQPGPGGPGWEMGPDWGMGPGHRRMSKEDRAAFLNARIAAVHAGLALTPEQEKLWPPVESAVRDSAKSMAEMFDKMREDKPRDEKSRDMIEGLKRRADMQIARGEAMKKVAEAAAPLYASLKPDQKERLPRLMRPGMGERIGHWMHRHGMHWGGEPGPGPGPRPGDRG